MKPLITYEDFLKLDLRIGKIIICEEKEGSEKLLRLTVDFGEEGTRNILTGIKAWYKPEDLAGRSFVFVFNLEPRKMMGELSEGMILATDTSVPIPLTTPEEVPPGSSIR